MFASMYRKLNQFLVKRFQNTLSFITLMVINKIMRTVIWLFVQIGHTIT